MADYRKMYAVLFNAITNALEQLEKGNFSDTEKILRKAQTDAEEIYIDTDDE